MASSSLEIFRNLKEDEENDKCLECSAANPTFTSVNNGCLICVNCVSYHLPLGPNISRVKAIDDQWDDEELKLMIAGGNSSLREFFLHYGIMNTPPNFRYLTKAAFFYRDMLAVVAQDKEYEQNCPDVEEGILLVNDADFDESEEEKTEEKSSWDWAKTAYHKTVNASSKVIEKVGEKLDKLTEKPAIKSVENKTIEFAGKIEAGFNQVVNTVYSKPEVQKTVEQVNKAADVLTQEVKCTYTKINSNATVQKLKMDTMNMLKGIGSHFSRSNN